MAGKNTGKIKLYLMLLPILAFWIVFAEWDVLKGFYQRLENIAMDWRFQVRGEMEVPEVKIAYVNIDAPTIQSWGERPWDRTKYALLAKYLLEHGWAKCVGFDLILSSESYAADLVSEEKIKESDEAMADLIRTYPGQIVLGANFTQINLPKTLEELQIDEKKNVIKRKKSDLPVYYSKDSVKPEDTYPEGPSYPIVTPTQGTVGIIGEDSNKTSDNVPRWVPLFADTNGPYHALNQMKGFLTYHGLSIKNVSQEGDLMVIKNDEGQTIFEMPYIQKKRFFHFSIELVLQAYGLDYDAVEVTEDYFYIRDENEGVNIEIPLADKQLLEVNWFTKFPIFQSKEDMETRKKFDESVSASLVLQHGINLESGKYGQAGFEEVDAASEFFKKFDEAIVLVGPTDRTLQDLAPTPFEQTTVPKVGMHGNAIKTIFSGLYIQRLPNWSVHVFIVCLTLVVAGFATLSGRFSLLCKGISALVLFGYVVAVFLIFNQWHLVIPIVAPVLSAVTTTLVGAAYQLNLEEKQKGRIKNMFGTYLSPTLVNQMVDSGEEPKLGGEDATITAFFSDVQSFSSFSELLEPTQLVDLMNEYLTAMTDILMDEGSYVDKYIGDAIVAMFNAPVHVEGHALKGCIAAVLVQNRQKELRAKWASEGDKWPSIVSNMQTRIGLNTGHATVGNMGSENRFNYTMMGDTVNLAARCESGAKAYGAYIMVAEDTYKEAIAAGDAVTFRYLDRIVVKGRTQPVGMYEVVGLKEELDEDTFKCLELFAEGIEFYKAQKWDDALAKFDASSKLEPNMPGVTPGVKDNPSTILIERCHYYKENPPGEDWDGVFVMTSK